MAQPPPKRPGALDLRSKSSASNASSGSRPLRSPRLHLAGEVPPDMSPLDAFALQSRLLARQLKDHDSEGRRMSRLPPLTIESPLVQQGRSDYFRSMQETPSEGSLSPEPQNEGLGLRTEVEEVTEKDRPKSMHPRMSRIPPTPDDGIPLPPQPINEPMPDRGRQLNQINEHEMSFGARREESPTPMEDEEDSTPTEDHASRPSSSHKTASLNMSSSEQDMDGLDALPTSPEKSAKKSFDGAAGLAPPRPSFSKRSPSAMSSPLETTDEDSAMGASFHSLPPRKLSSGSSAFSSVPAVSPALAYVPKNRSPSMSSDLSGPLPKPSFNFSRPLSRAGTPGPAPSPVPGPETPSRQASSDTQQSFVFADDTANTPISMNSEGFPDYNIDDGKSAAPSYIYSKFSLPRGKAVQRSVDLDSQAAAAFLFEQPISLANNSQRFGNASAPPSPPTRPSSSTDKAETASLSKLSLDRSGTAGLAPVSTDRGRMSEEAPRGRTLTSPPHDMQRLNTAVSTTTTGTGSTLKPARSQYSTATTSEMSAEDHLSKGVECHENGSVKESTYHLRHAAKLNHPTGMLLYALACRHGWGMRPNQKEGVEWLRKAVDAVSAEIADDEGHAKEGKFVDKLESKTRKAQFALSVYELGVSHMNGWGIEQDKALGLRCYEIAGSWGDTDALAEAGYCYAQGVGCKKDLKKAAKFYREAESRGMSMVGNSWIHKPKYLEDDKAPKQAKKARSKSRTRTMFGLKSGGSRKEAA